MKEDVVKEYLEFISNPENSHNCDECPELYSKQAMCRKTNGAFCIVDFYKGLNEIHED